MRKMGKILLVDDHPHIVRLLEKALAVEGHELLVAYDGSEAMRLVREHRPDLVFLDVVMPEIDGFRVLNRIKTDPDLSGTMVVMLTCKDEPDDVRLGLDIGADYYLPKPVSPKDVVSLVQRLFGQASSSVA